MKNYMKIFPYIYDFLSLLFEAPEAKKYIRHVILFGSVARGDFEKGSDVDIFINAPEDAAGKLEPLLKDSEKRFQVFVEKKWALLGIEMPIRYIIGDLETYRWKEIKSEIISTGVVLYGKYEAIKEGIRPYLLFTYSAGGLRPKDNMKLRRKLFGYRIKKKREYAQSGYVAETGGLRLGACILVPPERAEEMRKIFSKFRITPEIREIWMK